MLLAHAGDQELQLLPEKPDVQFSILDYPVFLTRGPSALLVADVSITVVFCVEASMAKTPSRS
jgi:hypothetical protein